MSRDWALDAPKCRRSACVACVFGNCISPSLIVIGEDGTCQGYRGDGSEEIKKESEGGLAR